MESPAIFLLRNTARIKAITTPKGTSISAYFTVFQRDWGINVFEEPLSEVFNDPDYRAAAISILTGKDGMDHLGPCRECLIYRKNVIRNGCGLMI